MRSRRPRSRDEIISHPKLLGLESPFSSDSDLYACESSCSSDSFTSYEQSLQHSQHNTNYYNTLRHQHSDLSIQVPELPLPPALAIRPPIQNIRDMTFSEYASEEFPDLNIFLRSVFPALGFNSSMSNHTPSSPSIRSPRPPLPPGHRQRKSHLSPPPQQLRRATSHLSRIPSLIAPSPSTSNDSLSLSSHSIQQPALRDSRLKSLPISSSNSSLQSLPSSVQQQDSPNKPSRRNKVLHFSEDPPELISEIPRISRTNSMPIPTSHRSHSQSRLPTRSQSMRSPLRTSNRMNRTTVHVKGRGKKDSCKSPVSENTHLLRRKHQMESRKDENFRGYRSKNKSRHRSVSLPPTSSRSLRVVDSTDVSDSRRRTLLSDKDSESMNHSFLIMGLLNLLQDALHNNE